MKHPSHRHPAIVINRGKWLMAAALLLVFAPPLPAQVPPQIPRELQGQFQLQQAPVVIPTNDAVSAAAEIDPPFLKAGGSAFLRVTVNASENRITPPSRMPVIHGLKFGPAASGQILRTEGGLATAQSMFVWEVEADTKGRFTISNLVLQCDGKPLPVPPVSFETVLTNTAPARQLRFELNGTNLFIGQPVRVRITLTGGYNNIIETLRDVQLNGGEIMLDKTTMRQSVSLTQDGGIARAAYVCEAIATPLSSGPQEVAAQAITGGGQITGPIVISGGQVTLPGAGAPSPVLLLSKPVKINVRTLPAESELPGFTGAMGKFIPGKTVISTNRIQVGEPLRLQYSFQPASELSRFVAPDAPRNRDWQILAGRQGEGVFMLIPHSDEVRSTPAIPFSAFDPESGAYYDLTIPPIPVTVTGQPMPREMRDSDFGVSGNNVRKLGAPASELGTTLRNMNPLQLQGWFICVQMAPVLGFIALWQWDRRRRFLEAHPEIIRMRKARRALRRELKLMRRAARRDDREQFIRHAAHSLRIASAPRHAADECAMVGADVLSLLDPGSRSGHEGDVVRMIFEASDSRFACETKPPKALLVLEGELMPILKKLGVEP